VEAEEDIECGEKGRCREVVGRKGVSGGKR